MSVPGARIRRMGAADVERVVEIAAGLPEAPHWPASVYLAALDPLHLPRRIALVAGAAASDAPVAFTVASVVAPQAELETIAVAAAAQRQGMGAGLLRALVEKLREDQVTELLLEVRVSNRTAIQFYRAQGFVETGRRARYYADPEEDAVLMELRLG